MCEKDLEKLNGLIREKNKQTYLESRCGYGTFGVAIVQRDDGDNILSVVPQVGQRVIRGVASELHRLHISTFT